jgi:hypothetical protein
VDIRLTSQARVALVVAHPGHELRVHGWMQASRPAVFVLTDGSGRSSASRLQASTQVLADLGLRPGSLFGSRRDLEFYDAFLKRDFPFFSDLAEQLAVEFGEQEFQCVVGDAAEGYSPTHDVCRLLIDAAVEIHRRRTGNQLANFEFAVVGPPDECPPELAVHAAWYHLDDETFDRKIAAVRGYNAELAREVEAALQGASFQGVSRLSGPRLAEATDTELGRQVAAVLHTFPAIEEIVKGTFEGIELNRFRTECLRPVTPHAARSARRATIPFYELYGEQMVAAGHYRDTIRYAEHFQPLVAAVWRQVAAC